MGVFARKKLSDVFFYVYNGCETSVGGGLWGVECEMGVRKCPITGVIGYFVSVKNTGLFNVHRHRSLLT